MDLLTNRLLVMAGQVADNQVAELIYNERLELERLRQRSPREKMLYSKTLDAENQARRGNFTNTISAKRLVISRKKKEENKYNAKEDGRTTQEGVPNVKEITTVCDILGIYKKHKNKGSKINESNEFSKETSASKVNFNKFRKAAKTTLLLERFKKGHVICTCESLDSRCKVHDN